MKLSKSKIFTYAWCPRQFKLIYIDGRKQEETHEMAVGNRLHEFFNDFFDTCEQVENWEDYITDDYSTEEQAMIVEFLNYEVDRYNDAESHFLPLFRELRIENDDYIGFVDRIDLIADNKVRIVEYKTGKKFDSAKMSQELWFYKMLFENVYPEYEVTEFRAYFPRLGEVYDLPITSRARTYLMKRIDKVKAAIESGEFKMDCNEFKWGYCGMCELEEIINEML